MADVDKSGGMWGKSAGRAGGEVGEIGEVGYSDGRLAVASPTA